MAYECQLYTFMSSYWFPRKVKRYKIIKFEKILNLTLSKASILIYRTKLFAKTL